MQISRCKPCSFFRGYADFMIRWGTCMSSTITAVYAFPYAAHTTYSAICSFPARPTWRWGALRMYLVVMIAAAMALQFCAMGSGRISELWDRVGDARKPGPVKAGIGHGRPAGSVWLPWEYRWAPTLSCPFDSFSIQKFRCHPDNGRDAAALDGALMRASKIAGVWRRWAAGRIACGFAAAHLLTYHGLKLKRLITC